MMNITNYTFGNTPALVPTTAALELGDDLGELVLTEELWATLARAVGQDPDDEELVITRLARDWHGHRAGDVVICGLAVEGHKFAVVPFEHVRLGIAAEKPVSPPVSHTIVIGRGRADVAPAVGHGTAAAWSAAIDTRLIPDAAAVAAWLRQPDRWCVVVPTADTGRDRLAITAEPEAVVVAYIRLEPGSPVLRRYLDGGEVRPAAERLAALAVP